MGQNSSKDVILVVATGWGAKHGGVNSFNKGFCIGLGNYVKKYKLREVRIVCVVGSSCSDGEINNARDNGMTLIPMELKKQNGFFDKEVIIKIKDKLVEQHIYTKWVKHIILHDITTGSIIKEKTVFPNDTKWSAIHHMNFNEYGHLKGFQEYKSRLEKTIEQYDLFKEADYIFAVGPLLKDLLNSFLTEKNIEKTAVEIIPGLTVIRREINHEKVIKGLTFGRFDSHHDHLKLASLAINAWNRAMLQSKSHYPNLENAELKVVGFDFSKETDTHKCKKMFEKFGKSIPTFEYINQEKLVNYIIKDSTISLMLSRHEGFGLTGWEAIGAGIPLILSKNSGLWRYLEQYKSGEFIECVHGIDIDKDYTDSTLKKPFKEEEADAVFLVLNKYFEKCNGWHTLAEQLKNELGTKHTWENTAKTFLKTIEIVPSEAQPYDKTSEDEDEKRNGISRIKMPELQDKMSISEFAQHCIKNAQALIISHRTKIFTPRSNTEPYKDMLRFLDVFTNPNNIIKMAKDGFNKTLLIFVLDFGAEIGNDGKIIIDEPSLYNYMILQSVLKGIFVGPFDLGTWATPSAIVDDFFSDNTILAGHETWAAHMFKLHELKNRVVIIGRNFNAYVERISEIEKIITNNTDIVTPVIKGEINNDKDVSSSQHIESEYILMNRIPALDHLDDDMREMIKRSTNIDGDKDAFGLYATVEVRDFAEPDQADVKCYANDNDIWYALPLVNSLKIGETTLHEKSIRNSMNVTYLAACHQLYERYWKGNEEGFFSMKIPNALKGKDILKRAHNTIKSHGFTLFTLPEFLSLPIMFPEESPYYLNPSKSKEA